LESAAIPIRPRFFADGTFTPTTSGIYYIHLKVTDTKGNTAQSDTARITVASVPVGGYSIPIQVQTKAEPVLPYIALIATLTAIFIKLNCTNYANSFCTPGSVNGARHEFGKLLRNNELKEIVKKDVVILFMRLTFADSEHNFVYTRRRNLA